ncbi:MAG TPA: GHMP kinase [Syntrophomonadaceae bacterium]|nr:GHMP kinase [Syntrophomonadaceae bacterium]
MIITRTPFRISFCGGGSDLAEFYEKHEGCVLSTTINKYMFISIHPYFYSGTTVIKYSKTEIVNDTNEIVHPIFKSVLQQFGIEGVEISSTADIPSGTGLGSSSTFTVGLLNAMHIYAGKYVSKGSLAENACDIEINRLGSPIGKQDQYAAAFGGLNYIRFLKNGDTLVEPVLCKRSVKDQLEKRLIMLYTGDVRNANAILSEQARNMEKNDKVAGLIRMCELAEELKSSLENGDLDAFGEILDSNWQIKRDLASGISNTEINDLYDTAVRNGAKGGKLLGAGGGGFLLFYCDEDKQPQVRKALGLRELQFEFESYGSTAIFVGDKYWD